LLAPALALCLVLGLAHIPLSFLVATVDRLGQEHLRLARYYLLTGEQPLGREALDAALKLGLAKDPEAARELRLLGILSQAMEGQGPQGDSAQANGPAAQPRQPAP